MNYGNRSMAFYKYKTKKRGYKKKIARGAQLLVAFPLLPLVLLTVKPYEAIRRLHKVNSTEGISSTTKMNNRFKCFALCGYYLSAGIVISTFTRSYHAARLINNAPTKTNHAHDILWGGHVNSRTLFMDINKRIAQDLREEVTQEDQESKKSSKGRFDKIQCFIGRCFKFNS